MHTRVQILYRSAQHNAMPTLGLRSSIVLLNLLNHLSIIVSGVKGIHIRVAWSV